jgi:hypothetical protein
MDTSTLFSVAPTFPVDDERLRELRWKRIGRSPVTWGGFIAAGALGFAMGMGFAGYVAIYALTAMGLHKYWLKHRAALDAASLRDIIHESNTAQDEELKRIIVHLNMAGDPQYALCLGRFLALKQKIEAELHRGAHLSGFAREIEKGVDGICAEVCREITRLRGREQEVGDVLTSRDLSRLDRLDAARRESQAAILHAYTSLYQTHAGILGLEATSKAGVFHEESKESEPGKKLNQILGDLRDEADLIIRTHARIKESLAETPSVESPPSPQPIQH